MKEGEREVGRGNYLERNGRADGGRRDGWESEKVIVIGGREEGRETEGETEGEAEGNMEGGRRRMT